MNHRLVLAGLIALSATVAGAAVKPYESQQLILALQLQREHTAQSIPSGQGRAVVTAQRHNGETATFNVSFRFRGPTSMAEYAAIAGSHTAVQKYLWDQGREIKYLLPGGAEPTAVSINSYDPGLSLLTADQVHGWSFLDFMNLGLDAPSDDIFFHAILNKKELTVSATKLPGSQLEIEVVAPPDPRHIVAEQKWVLNFDLNLGGVLTSVQARTRSTRTAKFPMDHDETMRTTWQRTPAGYIVPVNRHIQLTEHQGSRTRTVESDVKFTEFQAADITPAQLGFSALGVARGTPVVDHIRNFEWRHGDLGAEGLPSDEALRRAAAAGKAQAITKPAVGIAALQRATQTDKLDSRSNPWEKMALAGVVALLVMYLLWRQLRGGSNPDAT